MTKDELNELHEWLIDASGSTDSPFESRMLMRAATIVGEKFTGSKSMTSIYLIKELWQDPLENHNAYGYRAIGYVTSEERAKEIVAEAGVEPSNGWPLMHPTPRKQYKGPCEAV